MQQIVTHLDSGWVQIVLRSPIEHVGQCKVLITRLNGGKKLIELRDMQPMCKMEIHQIYSNIHSISCKCWEGQPWFDVELWTEVFYKSIWWHCEGKKKIACIVDIIIMGWHLSCIGIGTHNPGVYQGYLYPNPSLPVPAPKGTGNGYGRCHTLIWLHMQLPCNLGLRYVFLHLLCVFHMLTDNLFRLYICTN